MSKLPESEPTPRYRRPFMVERTMRLYSEMGQSDPVQQTFATRDEAVWEVDRLVDEGYDVYLYGRDSNGDWEEAPGGLPY